MIAPVSLRCYITLPLVGGKLLTGLTSLIGRQKVEFLLESGPEVNGSIHAGDPLYVDVDLPNTHQFAPRCIHCRGHVIRIAPVNETSTKVTLRAESIGFQEQSPAVRRAKRSSGLPERGGLEA